SHCTGVWKRPVGNTFSPSLTSGAGTEGSALRVPGVALADGPNTARRLIHSPTRTGLGSPLVSTVLGKP
ncbi:hypothetical protein ACLF3G_29565, partial [Falsiroseomonas sp. HC035]|uniref:hypothetical protein n=1 Tax=Falsiroseomonas sp. HC035 TaxID=3390999 RepID=UPI003D313F46